MMENAPTAHIHLDHIRSNFELAKSLAPGAKCMPVIKANAYGHGAIEVARALPDADAYAVARVVEAVQLREAKIDKPITVLEGYLGDTERGVCVEYDLWPMIYTHEQLEILPSGVRYWLKFNTGMFRLGFDPNQAAALAQRVDQQVLLGICTHFANADVVSHPMNSRQIESFKVIAEHFPNAPVCVANSGGIMNRALPEADWIRPGVMLYGGAPDGQPDGRLKPGMDISAPVVAIQHLNPGDQVGYGSAWQAEQTCRIAVVAFGYADGYPRELPTGTPVLVNGNRRQLVGRVSMDLCTVLLDEEDDIKVGDSVTFWGAGLPIDEIAQYDQTISYTLMTGLGSRVNKRYLTAS